MSATTSAAHANADVESLAPNRKPARIRLWFPVALLALYWAFIFVNQNFEFSALARFLSRMGALLLLFLIFTVWWLSRSVFSWRDRLLAIITVLAISAFAVSVADKSMSAFGFFLSAVPMILTAWTVWLLIARRADPFMLRAGFVALMMLVCGYFTLTRFDGLYTNQSGEVHWRWTPTSEQTYLEQRATAVSHTVAAAAQKPWLAQPTDSPEYRGRERNGVVDGVKLATDWNEHPPKLLWNKKVGPAWTGVIVVDGHLVTQEQRDQSEAVVCYDGATGDEIWAHEDPVRFEENLSGAGPRGTPTFADGRIYSYGGKALLNCLKAETGEVVWSHNCLADADVAPALQPQWGYSTSPLVADGLVIVYTGGTNKSVLAYHTNDGKLAWFRAGGKQSYSSPQLATLNGVKQIVMHDDRALMGLSIADGSLLWDVPSASEITLPMLQPHAFGENKLVVSSEPDLSMIEVNRDGDKWTATNAWHNNKLRAGFNDFVIHDGCVFALDDGVLCCIDAADGKRLWKKGRLGHGQVLLLSEQKLLLLLLEKGEVVSVSADRAGFKELGRFTALEGKTWNSPVVVGDRIYARNGEEMAAYQLDSQAPNVEKASSTTN